MKYYMIVDRQGTPPWTIHNGNVPIYYTYKAAKQARVHHTSTPSHLYPTLEDREARRAELWKIVAFETDDLQEVFE